MKRYSKSIKAVVAASVAALFGMFYYPMNGMRVAPAKPAAPYTSSFENVTVLNVLKDSTIWKAVSKTAHIAGDGLSATMGMVTVNVPAENISMQADNGALDMQTNIMELSGNVKSQVKGFEVSTGTVKIIPGRNISSAPGQNVLIQKAGMSIQGKDLEANTQRTVKLKDDVRAVFY